MFNVKRIPGEVRRNKRSAGWVWTWRLFGRQFTIILCLYDERIVEE